MTGWESAFWTAFESSRNPMMLVNDERRVTHANDAVVELLGETRNELVGSSVLKFVPPGETPSDDAHEELLTVGRQSGTAEIVRADGRTLDCDYAATRTQVPGRGPLTLYVTIDSREAEEHDGADTTAPRDPLTPREAEVTQLVALGRTTPAMADELGVSQETVRTHVRNAMEKTGTHTRAALVAAAFARKLL